MYIFSKTLNNTFIPKRTKHYASDQKCGAKSEANSKHTPNASE